MQSTHTVVIGAGQAGLAASRWLTYADHEHVVLERGQIGSRWINDSWDSLRLLTPNWMTRLPGLEYRGDEPEAFMSAADFVDLLEGYAHLSAAPVREGVDVVSVARADGMFRVRTSDGTWIAKNVIVATGWCQKPSIPPSVRGVTAHQIAPSSYRNPDLLPDGHVLVVGASSSGVQIADEIAGSGRDVTLAVGQHTRMPRTYRGVDAMWWLDQIGALDRSIDTMPDPHRARREPSLQLAGGRSHRRIDLASLQRRGIRLAGRLLDAHRAHVRFADDLESTTTDADRRLDRLRRRIDRHIEESGMTQEVWDSDPIVPINPANAPMRLDLRKERIATIVWATGYQREHDWLDLPVFDDTGEIWQRRGVTTIPGCYVLGQRFQHTRRSNFIDGVGADARFVVEHLAARDHNLTPAAQRDLHR